MVVVILVGVGVLVLEEVVLILQRTDSLQTMNSEPPPAAVVVVVAGRALSLAERTARKTHV